MLLSKGSSTSAVLFLIYLLPVVVRCSKAHQKKQILNNIFTDYNRDVPPHADDDGPVIIELRLSPIHIAMDEQHGILETHAWLAMRWFDNRLSWDRRQYEDVDTVHTNNWRIWKPDFKAYNGVDQSYYMSTDCILRSDGLVFWIPPVTFRTACDLDYSYWPWDVQVCKVVIGSWTKTGEEIDLVVSLDDTNRNVSNIYSYFYPEHLWEIAWSKAIISRMTYGSQTFYPDYTVLLALRRASFIDRKIAVLPIIVAACLTLATFWTHPLARSRMSMGTTNFIVMILLMMFFRSRLPMAGGQLPLIVTFAGSMTILVTLQLLMSLGVANLVSRKDQPPPWLVTPLYGILGKVLCLSNLPLFGQIPNPRSFTVDVAALRIEATEGTTPASGNEAKLHNAVGPKPGQQWDSSSDSFSGWNLFAQALDRVFFAVYLFIIVIFIGVYFGGVATQEAQT